MPAAAFVAVARLPLPPLESELLLPVGTKGTVQSTIHCGNTDDACSLQDYRQQTIASSSVLLPRSNTEHNQRPM